MTARTEKNMLSKLHLKFTVLICGVAALILMVSFGYIAWSNHNQKIQAVYTELNVALESVEAKGPHSIDSLSNNTFVPNDDTPFDFNFDYSDATPPRIGDKEQTSWSFPIALYTVREKDGASSVDIISRYSTAIVDEDTLKSALDVALSSESDQGFLQSTGLYYKKATFESGALCIAFADQSVVEDGSGLVRSLALVGAAIMLLVFALAWLFSRWAVRPVQRAWDSQQQFIADASHEMKTPLTVIMANASIALKKPEASIAEQSQWIEGIQEEAQNMEHLVLDMLTLAQPENTKKKKTAAQTVNLSDAAEQASLQFEAVAFERGIMLEEEIEPNIFVMGDVVKIQRLLGTLVDNACKYADKDTAIKVTLKRSGRNCTLSVHNWGNPIAPEDIPHVFDRFYRSDKSRDRSGEDGSHSFGLGLAIAQKIAQEQGGTLTVTSTAEEGTTFTVSLACKAE